jgi:hypothetical protein
MECEKTSPRFGLANFLQDEVCGCGISFKGIYSTGKRDWSMTCIVISVFKW